MIDPLYFANTAICLACGAALLLAWRRDHNQSFLRMVGLAFLLHALLPGGYALMRASPAPLNLVALGLLLLVALFSAGLILMSVAYLADRPLSRRDQRIGAAVLALGALALLRARRAGTAAAG
ncbi:hypothetical protein [Piscinibacter sp.]|uniref:hypothetical protein n=1 Tax=Piscinibacter sp. TaxID=1903157 RepID=UPI0035B35F79